MLSSQQALSRLGARLAPDLLGRPAAHWDLGHRLAALSGPQIAGLTHALSPAYLGFVRALARTFSREQLAGLDATDEELEMLAAAPRAVAEVLLPLLQHDCPDWLRVSVMVALDGVDEGLPEETLVAEAAASVQAWIEHRRGERPETCQGIRASRLWTWVRAMDRFTLEELRALHFDDARVRVLLAMPAPAWRALLPLAGALPRDSLVAAARAALAAARQGKSEEVVIGKALGAARRRPPRGLPGFEERMRPGPFRP